MLNVLCSFSSISAITSSILIVIGYVREIRYMFQFAVPTLEDFFGSQCYINTVEDVDWVSLAPDRKVWKASLNVVMSLHIL